MCHSGIGGRDCRHVFSTELFSRTLRRELRPWLKGMFNNKPNFYKSDVRGEKDPTFASSPTMWTPLSSHRFVWKRLFAEPVIACRGVGPGDLWASALERGSITLPSYIEPRRPAKGSITMHALSQGQLYDRTCTACSIMSFAAPRNLLPSEFDHLVPHYKWC